MERKKVSMADFGSITLKCNRLHYASKITKYTQGHDNTCTMNFLRYFSLLSFNFNDIAEILLKVALNTKNQIKSFSLYMYVYKNDCCFDI